MTITSPLDKSFRETLSGTTTDLELLWRQKQSKMAGGRTVVKDVGSMRSVVRRMPRSKSSLEVYLPWRDAQWNVGRRSAGRGNRTQLLRQLVRGQEAVNRIRGFDDRFDSLQFLRQLINPVWWVE